jgi:PAS domain S-box-containing protein
MSVRPSPTIAGEEPSRFEGKLSRSVVLLMVLISLLPLVLVGAATFYRSRQLLRSQAESQLMIITKGQANELEQLHLYSQSLVDRILSDEGFRSAIDSVLADPGKLHKRALAAWQMNRYCDISLRESGFHSLALFLPDQTLLASTNKLWETAQVSENQKILNLLPNSASIALFNPAPHYPDQFVIFTAFTIPDAKGEPAATIIGAIVSDLPRSSITTANSFFSGARAYYGLNDQVFLSVDPKGNFSILPNDSISGKQGHSVYPSGLLQSYQSPDGTGMLAYSRWIPALQMSVSLEVPLDSVYQQLNVVSPINAAILITGMLFSAVIVYLASRRIVQPLLTLVGHARKFSEGDWDQRAVVNRNDELGLLAHTFNVMVGQLSDLYRSLESKVSERSRQIRMASEIGHYATSTQDRGEVIQRASEHIKNRFGYSYVAIYLVEESGLFLHLEKESPPSEGQISFLGARLRISSDTLVGYAASLNQPRVTTGLDNQGLQRQYMQPEVNSEAAIPIAVGNLVFGVMQVQSIAREAFDPDTVAVLHTLANHIAYSLQNLRLLQTAQVNLQETALLYRVSRQISQATNEAEVIRLVSSALKETAFVSGFYAVKPDHISIIGIFDPREPGAPTSEGITLPLKNIPTLLQETRIVMIEEINHTDFDHLLSFFKRRSCRSVAIIPLHEENCLTKMVVLGALEGQDFSETALQPYANLLAVAATTLERFRIFNNLQDRLHELQILTEISQHISQNTDPHLIYQTLYQVVQKIVGGDCEFSVALFHSEANEVEITYAMGTAATPGLIYSIGDDPISTVISTQKPLLINAGTHSPTISPGTYGATRTDKSWLGIPLSVGQKTIGAVILQDHHDGDRFSGDQIRLLSTIAPQIATSIRSAQFVIEMEVTRQAAQQENLLLETLLRNIPDHTYYKDCDGRYLRVSSSYANHFNGAHPEEFIGKNDIEILGYEEGTDNSQIDQAIISSGQKQIGIVENRLENEKETWRLASRIPLAQENGIKGVLVMLRDITSLKMAEIQAKRNADQLRTAAEIARNTSGTLDLQELLKKAVTLVCERFGYDHASILLLDSTGDNATLQESTGMVGEQMKANHHTVRVGSNSIIGQVTASGEALVINDLHMNPLNYPEPLLPDTRAELAIPLKIGSQVLGALDVLIQRDMHFTEQDVLILQILADQISVAVHNANLFARTEENIARHRLLHEITTRAALAITSDDVIQATLQSLYTVMPDDRVSVFLLNQGRLTLHSSMGHDTTPFEYASLAPGEGIAGRAVQDRTAVLNSKGNPELAGQFFNTELAAPIIYSRNVVGVIMAESTKINAYDEYDQEIMETLGSILGPILYNTHLMAEVRQQVERQRMIYEATSRIHRSVDIQTILETSAAEISKAVGARSAQIEIAYGPENGGQSGENP